LLVSECCREAGSNCMWGASNTHKVGGKSVWGDYPERGGTGFEGVAKRIGGAKKPREPAIKSKWGKTLRIPKEKGLLSWQRGSSEKHNRNF